MKLKYFIIVTIIFILLESCGALKKEFAQNGGRKEAIKNAIVDFSNKSRLYKKDSVFSVWSHDPLYRMVLKQVNDGNITHRWIKGKPYEGIIAVSISSSYRKILLTDKAIIGEKDIGIPTRFIEKDGKLFYWWDEDYPLTQEALTVFKKYNLLTENNIDGVIEFYDFKIDDSQKGVDYYFCKSDLTKYKKVTTNKAIGYYDLPTLDCSLQ